MEYISFESKILENKAKSELKKRSDAESFFVKIGRKYFITSEGARHVEKIRIHSSDFTNSDLGDLKYFANLKLLEIFSFGLTGLRNIPELKNIETLRLRLGDDNAVDLGDLEKLSNLRNLDLEGLKSENEQPWSIQQLSSLRKLRVGRLGGNKIDDCSCLNGLEYMMELGLNSSQIRDITPLGCLKKLKILDIGGNRVTDISPLKTLKNLKILRISGNPIRDISPLSELVSLEKLYINSNNIRDIKALSTLKNLKTVELMDNPISSIEPLFFLENLESIATDTGKIYEPLALKFEKSTGVRTAGGVNGEEYEYWGFDKKQ